MKISILTVTYGDRFKYLQQVLDRCASESRQDKRLFEIIIVDNNSSSSQNISKFIENNRDVNTKHITLKENKGSAGGFSAGLEYFLTTKSDYVLLLDDDNVPESNFIKYFTSALFLFPKKDRQKIILSGRRSAFTDIRFFYGKYIPNSQKSLFGFNMFNYKVVLSLIKKHIFNESKKLQSKKFIPICIQNGFAYGGAFLSKEIISLAGLPLKEFFTYADDVEWSNRIKTIGGGTSYSLFHPYIEDVDINNREGGFLAPFSKNNDPFRVFLNFRNNTYNIIHINQANKAFFLANTFIILLVMNLFYIFKKGINMHLIQRNRLIIKSIKRGIIKNFDIPEHIGMP